MKEGNRWCVLLLLVLILLPPGRCTSASLRLQSDTLLRSFERETTKDGKFKVIPVYEYLQADFRDLSGQAISFTFMAGVGLIWGMTAFSGKIPMANCSTDTWSTTTLSEQLQPEAGPSVCFRRCGQ